MKKIVFVILGLMIMFMFLVGCGNKNITTYKDKDGEFKISFPNNYMAYQIGGEEQGTKLVAEHVRVISKDALETNPVIIVSKVIADDPGQAVIKLLETLHPNVKVIKTEPFNYWQTKLSAWRVLVDIGLEEPEYIVLLLEPGEYIIIGIMERGTTPEDFENFYEMLVTSVDKY